MKRIVLLVAVLVLLSVQTVEPMSEPTMVRHLVYQFGYNTPAASSGTGTGTTTIDISGPVKDGGVMISGTDHWWNTVRPRATNTCQVSPNGNVSCSQAPYAISPMQLTIFPLLAHDYFKGLNASATSSWKRTFHAYAAIIPGASGFAGQPNTWNCVYALQGKGPIKGAGSLVLIEAQGTLTQQGGTYLKANSKERIVYDQAAQIPGIVSDVRTHIPVRSIYNNDLIELKLTRDSGLKH